MSGVSGLRGQRVYGQHGRYHSPRGSDPGATEAWRNVSTGTTAWSSGTNYSAGAVRQHNNLIWEAILPSGPGNGGAIEPGVDSSYVAYWWCQASVFVNGANATPTTSTPNPVPFRYRLSVGSPNILDTDGSIIEYTDHQIDVQGDVISVVIGDTVFVIPPEYQHDYDVPYHTHDIYGAYVPCRLLKTGEFIWGTV